MKKSIKKKTKSPSKKMAKKPAKKAAKKVLKKTTAPKKSASKSGKKLSISELFELKKKKMAMAQNAIHSDQTIPPHELDDKVGLQKSKAVTKLRSGPGGTRHH